MDTPQIQIPKDHVVVISTKPKVWANAPLFHCIGGEKKPGKIPGFKKLYIIFRDMSKTAHWFWWSLVEDRNLETNMVTFRAAKQSESKKISAAYKELYSLGLIKRVARQKYIINPKVMFPIFKTFEKVWRKWELTL